MWVGWEGGQSPFFDDFLDPTHLSNYHFAKLNTNHSTYSHFRKKAKLKILEPVIRKPSKYNGHFAIADTFSRPRWCLL